MSAVIALGFAALIVVVAMMMFLSRRRTATKQRSTTDMRAALLFLACDQCGKKLKVNNAAAGKKIKCPNCNTMIIVPGPSA